MLFGWPGNGLLAGRMEKSTEIEGVIVEFYQVGNAVKVSAVDTKTFLEVSIVAPAHCSGWPQGDRTDTEAIFRDLWGAERYRYGPLEGRLYFPGPRE